MVQSDFGAVAVDFCRAGCGGLWFDWSELARVDEPDEGVGEALDAALECPAAPERARPLRCTRCDIPMQEHRYQGVPRVLIDECYGCRGLFLDPGELRAIRDALEERTRRHSKVEHLLKHDVLFRRELDDEWARNARSHALTTVCRALSRKVPGFFF